jgi:hypothetical protein
VPGAVELTVTFEDETSMGVGDEIIVLAGTPIDHGGGGRGSGGLEHGVVSMDTLSDQVQHGGLEWLENDHDHDYDNNNSSEFTDNWSGHNISNNNNNGGGGSDTSTLWKRHIVRRIVGLRGGSYVSTNTTTTIGTTTGSQAVVPAALASGDLQLQKGDVVVRGGSWAWGMEDGGPGCKGVVQGIQAWKGASAPAAAASSLGASKEDRSGGGGSGALGVLVKWRATGYTGLYRTTARPTSATTTTTTTTSTTTCSGLLFCDVVLVERPLKRWHKDPVVVRGDSLQVLVMVRGYNTSALQAGSVEPQQQSVQPTAADETGDLVEPGAESGEPTTPASDLPSSAPATVTPSPAPSLPIAVPLLPRGAGTMYGNYSDGTKFEVSATCLAQNFKLKHVASRRRSFLTQACSLFLLNCPFLKKSQACPCSFVTHPVHASGGAAP